MLESVLADVLTRVLGQYLEGIDRENVNFGAWSGLVELRGVALRPEALAVLFENLGMNLPVTVEAGFIGLLRLQVPWNAIGTTPVQIHMEDITIMARPVRGDGSDDSELELRERRIKRAKLNTDDAVREASWGVAEDAKDGGSSWSNWLVSDQLRAKIIDNIQITLKDILLRFEDPFSDPRKPYMASLAWKSLKAVSANDIWQEAFVERAPEAQCSVARKLLEVKGFRIDWAPITPRDTPGLSRGTAVVDVSGGGKRFETPEMLKQFMTGGGTTREESASTNSEVKILLHPVDGSLRLRFLASGSLSAGSAEENAEPPVDLDIRFPDVLMDFDDVQYACLLQTSVYFAKLATRGFRPRSPKARWTWAIDQLLPGFSARRVQMLAFTPKGILDARDRKLQYFALRKSLLKSRRMCVEQPGFIAKEIEKMEDVMEYAQIMRFRDYVDRQIENDGEDWRRVNVRGSTTTVGQRSGTTTSSFWQMLGYKEENPAPESSSLSQPDSVEISTASKYVALHPERGKSCETKNSVSLRVAFLLRAARIRLSQNGFPRRATPRVALVLRDLRVGMLCTTRGELTVEGVLRSIEAWDILKGSRMVYSRLGSKFNAFHGDEPSDAETSYPFDVSDAIDAIRSGSNPAKDMLVEDDEDSDDHDDLSSDQFFDNPDEEPFLASLGERIDGRRRARQRTRGTSGSRDSTPSSSAFRVTENEFLGTFNGGPVVQKYVAAFRYKTILPDGPSSSKLARSKLEMSVATLEAIVDGPECSFVWGLKFWKPKGRDQDPIIAFLGAAAGARITELRMELEEALLANTVPLQINAVILAPRIIISSSSELSPAVVVNMGKLGICTSDSSPDIGPSSIAQERKKVKYSNYVLTLDDLGVYISPTLTSAVSQNLKMGTGERSSDGLDLGYALEHIVDTREVERIIRPFSLRFVLQTLRDSNVVQVVHAATGSSQSNIDIDNIAKVRVRGCIPGFYLILTQAALQHVIIEARRWSQQLRPDVRNRREGKSSPPAEGCWQPLVEEEEDVASVHADLGNFAKLQEVKKLSDREATGPPPTRLASYDVKVMMEKVSVELRNSNTVRLVTASASKMQANIVKTGRKTLQASFRLRSWSITDRSRGSTAAFRRLVYAGTFAEQKGVSPPRSISAASEGLLPTSSKEKDFVDIKYSLDLFTKEHKIDFQFLSLNVVCVRETYILLAAFFYKVYRATRDARDVSADESRNQSSRESLVEIQSAVEGDFLATSQDDEPEFSESELSLSKILVTSQFDGFSLQLIASGGAIALVEMRDSKIQFLRDENHYKKAWGDFRYFSVRDWTAPIGEHAAVLTYEQLPEASRGTICPAERTRDSGFKQIDEWVLCIPKSDEEPYQFQASFRGIRGCFLYRFSFVLQQYFEVLRDGIRPVLDVVLDQVSDPERNEQGGIHSSVTLKEVRTGKKMLVNLEFGDLAVRVPRHSGCPTEALIINVSRIDIKNAGDLGKGMQWCTRFVGVDMATNYLLPGFEESGKDAAVSSTFLKDFAAEMILQRKDVVNTELKDSESSSLHIGMQTAGNVLFELAEAQYTVLYFILTENLAETITGAEMSVDLGVDSVSLHCEEDRTLAQKTGAQDVNIGEVNDAHHLNVQRNSSENVRVDIDVSMPSLSMELSRGWDVEDEQCKVVGIYLSNVELDFTYNTLSQLLFDLSGKLIAVADLRREGSNTSENFVVPLFPQIEEFVSGGIEQGRNCENITVSYVKDNGERPSIVVSLRGLQVEVVPELFRDLTYLAIPGWPYLETSALAPDVVYVGRIMTVVLSDSQVILLADDEDDDRRAIILNGDFQLKLDWMRGTGAKSITLQSSQVEVSTSPDFPLPVKSESSGYVDLYHAVRLSKALTLLVYPTNSVIEYTAANFDDGGCRLDISLDSVLCLINVGVVPLLRSVLSRTSNIKATYLSRRDWVQGSKLFTDDSQLKSDAKAERIRKARENMNLSVTIPAARFLITDEADGRFIPVLEARFRSFDVNAHVGSMAQVHCEINMDLFNTNKGWWEPALESWPLAASLSHGQSGTRTIVLKSDRRLNMNITPTTVAAAITVAQSLKSAGSLSGKYTRGNEGVQVVENIVSRHGPERSTDITPSRRPSVAAFFIRNEMGIPIYMSSNNSSRRTIIAHNTEVEAGVQSDELLTSSADGDRTSRNEAMKCLLTLPSYSSIKVSAAEVGRYNVNFFPSSVPSGSQDELSSIRQVQLRPIRALWEVEMTNGVPTCTVRSLFRFVNRTETAVELHITLDAKFNDEVSPESIQEILPGKSFSIPISNDESAFRIRPITNRNPGKDTAVGNVSSSKPLFDWSSSFPSYAWLCSNVRELLDTEGICSGSSSSAPAKGSHAVIRCPSTQGASTDFFFALTALCPTTLGPKGAQTFPWVDIVLRAPVVLHNHLPGPLSYRVIQRHPCPGNQFQSVHQGTFSQGEGIVLAAGLMHSLKDTHLHFTGDKLKSTFLSLAFDNSTGNSEGNFSPGAGVSRSRAPSRFGPEISFEDMELRKTAVILPSAHRSVDARGQPRKDFRVVILPRRKNVSHFVIFAGFWIRNRSDTSLQVCSRGSYYGSSGQSFLLRERPPLEPPDDFVCLEGPYLSLRLPRTGNSKDDELEHWWTSPSMVVDADKPMSVNLGGLSLEIEVSAAPTLTPHSLLVTIRNTSWICNSTSSLLQWCQTSALDSHGNCVLRSVKTIWPGEIHGIHWDQKSFYKAVHLRLAESNGQSDWIWSPAIPLNSGHSRELPAKMYRPKTYEQYIARVASKEISGNTTALVIYGEDRNNPPYRIVNLCKHRAIAFSQLGSKERPWLVRAGKTTRYSWDNPLASPSGRLLSIRILEPEDLLQKPKGTQSGSSARDISPRHSKCNLNIDIVSDRAMVLSESYSPAVVINICVDGATKIVTFCEENVGSSSNRDSASGDDAVDSPVLVVGWDDMGLGSQAVGENVLEKRSKIRTVLSDYGLKSIQPENLRSQNNAKKAELNTDAALFLHSVGISVITKKPVELLYVSLKDVLVNYESCGTAESFALQVGNLQIDNQLEGTPYPVLLWMSSPRRTTSSQHDTQNQFANDNKALAVEVHRTISDDDILMIKSFQTSIRPFSICFEDDFISKSLSFLSETSIMGNMSSTEFSEEQDVDYHIFSALLPKTTDGVRIRTKSSWQEGILASKRIYVHNFNIHKTSLRLTSSGSGSAVARAAGMNSSAKALVALVLNVENCEFAFPSLSVQNVFDSAHHFAILVKQYYISQLRNQRMKLLASNSLMGNPAALFDAVGTGARDFFAEPVRAKGSVDFIASVGRGSKSLFANTVGGLVQSVGSIPRAVSSGLEKAVGDNEYLAERERIRGSNVPGSHRGSSANNPAQGLATGALSFAHGISSGVTGLIREPVQGAKKGGAGGLLKGIGRAFIGGVAKPMAGAIDLVAEPAAGLSRQIADVDPSLRRQSDWRVVPERPPRAFRGRNQRLNSYDRRYSVGVCLYRAVQFVSGVTYESELLDWIELSDRQGRGDLESELWVWNVVQRYSRSMPGTKKQIGADEKAFANNGSRLDVRPEKVRVALVTYSDVIIATLDCKLVKSITLWEDCTYSMSGQGKDVVFKMALKSTQSTRHPSQDFDAFFSGAQSMIAAPWDASSAGRRLKPGVGEELVDRIPCGSAEARDELLNSLNQVLRKINDTRERVDWSSSVELSRFGKEQEDNSIELEMAGEKGKRETGLTDLYS